MPEVLRCLMVIVLCGVMIATVTVAACGAAALLQWLAEKITDWWWRE